MTRIAPLAVIATLVLGGCAGSETTTTVTTSAGAAGASGASGPSRGNGEPETADEIRKAVLSGDVHASLRGANVLDCVYPKTTPAPEMLGCLREAKRTLVEFQRQGHPYGEFCSPFYPDFCIPFNRPDLDCAGVFNRYALFEEPFTVSRWSDPFNFDEDRDRIGCEPYP